MRIGHRRAALMGGLLVVLGSATRSFAEELTLEGLITNHLSAVGAGVVSRTSSNIQGRGRLQILVGGRAALTGPFYLQSRGAEVSYFLHFNVSNYEQERFVANAENAEIGFMTPGTRSPLADFLYVQKAILREGLWGGVLSTAFPFFDIGARQPRLKYAGLKKEDGRKLHRIDYEFQRPQGDLRVRLFFDPGSFHHVRTTYELVIPAPLGVNTVDSARQKSTRHQLTEEFADFRREGGLVVPHQWKVSYLFDSTDQTLSWEWNHELLAFQFNTALDDSVFRAEGN